MLCLGFYFIPFAQAKTSKEPSSFEYYLNLHHQAQQQIPPPPRYKLPEPPAAVATTIEKEKINLDDATAPIEPEPIAYLPAPASTLIPDEVIEIEPTEKQEEKVEEVLTENNIESEVTTSTQFPALKNKPLGVIAIIIDDIGNQEALDMRVAKLPGAVTLAVLPHTPHGKSVAQLAHQLNKDVMLHAPMESSNHRKLGDGALTQELGQLEFEKVLQDSINSIPHVIGVNNHMGSLLTQNPEAMNWVMQVVQKNNLFFIDSRTTPNSVAESTAKQHDIPTISRHVFLDNEQTHEYVDEAFKKTLQISRKTGFALAIGHPYPSTVTYLEKAIPELAEQGYLLVPVSLVMAEKMKSKTLTSQDNSLAKK